jgi:hypothetical protein
VVCGRTNGIWSFGSGPRGKGGGVQIAVDVIVELVVVEMVSRVEVKVTVLVDVVNTGGGVIVAVTEIVSSSERPSLRAREACCRSN